MRDLQADLEICNKATPGPWIRSKFGLNILTHDSEISTATQKYSGTSLYAEEQIKKLEANANFIAAAREGWPEATERAIKAEEIVKKYATAARTIALYLNEFCDTTLPYDEMIAEASRKADNQLSILREENELQRHSIQELSKQVVKLQAERDICGKWPVRIGEYFCGAEIVGADYKRKTVTIEWRAMEVTP